MTRTSTQERRRKFKKKTMKALSGLSFFLCLSFLSQSPCFQYLKHGNGRDDGDEDGSDADFRKSLVLVVAVHVANKLFRMGQHVVIVAPALVVAQSLRCSKRQQKKKEE